MTIRVINLTEEGRWGGPQARIVLVAEALKNYDVQTIVFTPNSESERFCRSLAERNVSYFTLRLTRLSRTTTALIKYCFLFFPELLNLVLAIKRHDASLVHCNGAWQIKGVLAAKIAGVRVLWHINDAYMPSSVCFLLRILGPLADGFIFSSERSRTFYRGMLPSRPFVISYPPVDNVYFSADATAPPQGMDFTRRKVITVCNINPGKGLETFVNMAAKINAVRKDVEFYIVGPVPESQRAYGQVLRDHVKQMGVCNLRFLGARDDIPALLAASDVFVCSSLYESGPMTIFEAMAKGLPVVSTDVGDVKDVLSDGYVVKVGDSVAMAEKVGFLLDNAELCLRHKYRAISRARALFSTNLAAKRHAEIYRSLCVQACEYGEQLEK